VTRLRQTDLRFRPVGPPSFSGSAGLDLSADDMTALSSRTEGWVAGLQMAVLALQAALAEQGLWLNGRSKPRITFAHSRRQSLYLDYLVKSCNDNRNLFSVLLQTSILNHLTGSCATP
jgi:LuxR family maltose regulon positive regulatory protein